MKGQSAPLFSYHQYDWGASVEFETATKEALLDAGFAQEYMFDQLGSQRSRFGSTDNGDRFELKLLPSGRYKLELSLNVDPDKSGFGYPCQFGINIGDMLSRIKGCAV